MRVQEQTNTSHCSATGLIEAFKFNQRSTPLRKGDPFPLRERFSHRQQETAFADVRKNASDGVQGDESGIEDGTSIIMGKKNDKNGKEYTTGNDSDVLREPGVVEVRLALRRASEASEHLIRFL